MARQSSGTANLSSGQARKPTASASHSPASTNQRKKERWLSTATRGAGANQDGTGEALLVAEMHGQITAMPGQRQANPRKGIGRAQQSTVPQRHRIEPHGPQRENNQREVPELATDKNTMRVRLTFMKPILGTKPADPEIHSHYVASKAPDAQTMREEIAALGTEEVEERGKTIFFKMEDGTPYLRSYQIKGFFKEAARTLKKTPGTQTKGLSAFLKKVDNFIFVYGDIADDDEVIPMYMPMDLDLTATDCQRPLRASTPMGERVALAHSEEAPRGTWMEFSVYCLDPADLKYVREWLDYGRFKGLGQWRNAGYGRFTWEEL